MDFSWSLLRFLKVTLVVTSIYWCILLSVLVFLLLGQCGSSTRSTDDSTDAQTGLLTIVFIIVLSVCGGALVILLVAFHLLSQQYFKDSEHQIYIHPNHKPAAHNHTEWTELTTPLTTFLPYFQRYTNLETLVPFLCQRGVLHPSELECLLRHDQRSTQISYLLTILDRKGPAGVVAVINCLKQDEFHLGHLDLASILEKHY